MPVEIERKFLVADDGWRAAVQRGEHIRQGYVARGPAVVVRVRVCGADAFLTLKGRAEGAVRAEYEYAVPRAHAEELLAHACEGAVIEKTRHHLLWRGAPWTVDEFEGALAGLVMAEIELTAADQPVALPPWAGREVTDDPAYRNEALARRAG